MNWKDVYGATQQTQQTRDWYALEAFRVARIVKTAFQPVTHRFPAFAQGMVRPNGKR